MPKGHEDVSRERTNLIREPMPEDRDTMEAQPPRPTSLLTRLYGRRVINVNVNIVLAGVLALIPTVGVVHLVTRFGVEDKRLITGITFVADVIFDVGIYFVLHWMANRLPLRGRLSPAIHLKLFKDATLVQFERMTISPLFYFVALGGQHTLLHMGITPEPATVMGFAAAIFVTRSLHTMWMLRQERKAAKLAATSQLPQSASPASTQPANRPSELQKAG